MHMVGAFFAMSGVNQASMGGFPSLGQSPSFQQRPHCCHQMDRAGFSPECNEGGSNMGNVLGPLLGAMCGAGSNPQQMTQMLMGLLVGMMSAFAQNGNSPMMQGGGPGPMGPMGPMSGFGGGGGQFGGGGHPFGMGQGNYGGGQQSVGPAGLNHSPSEGHQVWDSGMNSNRGFSFRAGMNIDTDGVGSSHGDRWHQNQTSMRLAGGGSLNADNTPYMVLPPQMAKQYGVKPGDLALVKYHGRVSPAVFGDVGPRNKLGEGSTRLAANLGINTDPNKGGIEGGVEYQVFPGSGKGVKWTHENTTTDALWQRIRSMNLGQ
jgi:hypothetical protein